jgi:hypothetical protein
MRGTHFQHESACPGPRVLIARISASNSRCEKFATSIVLRTWVLKRTAFIAEDGAPGALYTPPKNSYRFSVDVAF